MILSASEAGRRQRGQTLGGERWVQRTARRLGLEHTFRPRGRPRKQKNPGPPSPQ